MITDINDKEIYERALKTWGIGLQIKKLWEECCELGVACSKVLDNGLNDNFIEEIADVENMIEQMKIYWNDGVREKIDIIRLQKLNRVKSILDSKEIKNG